MPLTFFFSLSLSHLYLFYLTIIATTIRLISEMKMKYEKYITVQCSTGKKISSIFSTPRPKFPQSELQNLFHLFCSTTQTRRERSFLYLNFHLLKNISSFLTSMDEAAADKMWKLKIKKGKTRKISCCFDLFFLPFFFSLFI